MRVHEGAGRVLFVEDEPDMRDLVTTGLSQRGFTVDAVASAEQALERISDGELDVVVTDVHLGSMDGITLCERIGESDPELPVVILTGLRETATALAAIRVHVDDFVTKPVRLAELELAVARAVRERRLRQQIESLTKQLDEAESELFLGDDPQLTKIFETIARVADISATVLITGESGTGKELVARSIHRASSRPGPLVAVNCAAVPPNLLESELFGHVKGAFTNAAATRQGLFARADQGTLFLDEVGEMGPDMQVKLLRALQERKIRPVGGDEAVPVDARVIAATNRDLSAAVRQGTFREDLYYRINVIPIAVPPLRERPGDILVLAQHFIDRAAARLDKAVTKISMPVARLLLEYPWPGNVRELENCMTGAVAMARFAEVKVEDLPEEVVDHSSRLVAPVHKDEPLPALEEVQRRHIARVLRLTNGNRTKAARILDINRRTLYRYLKRFDIDVDALTA